MTDIQFFAIAILPLILLIVAHTLVLLNEGFGRATPKDDPQSASDDPQSASIWFVPPQHRNFALFTASAFFILFVAFFVLAGDLSSHSFKPWAWEGHESIRRKPDGTIDFNHPMPPRR